jgi:hypothetical protein
MVVILCLVRLRLLVAVAALLAVGLMLVALVAVVHMATARVLLEIPPLPHQAKAMLAVMAMRNRVAVAEEQALQAHLRLGAVMVVMVLHPLIPVHQ